MIVDGMSVAEAHGMLEEFVADVRGYVDELLDDVGLTRDSYEECPLSLLAPLEDYLDVFPPDDGAADDPWVRLQLALSAYVADLLIAQGGRWEVDAVPDDPTKSAFVVRVTGATGRTSTVDPVEIIQHFFDPDEPDMYWPVVNALHEAGVAPWHRRNHPDTLPDAPVTPVQLWVLGMCAHFATMNDYRPDRLGADPATLDADRLTALKLLHSAWGAYDAERLDRQIRSLLEHGHRAEFEQSAALAAALSDAERAEYSGLLRKTRRLSERDRLGPDDVDFLGRLVELRYGAAAGELRRHLMPLLAGTGGPDDGPAAAELHWFLGQVMDRHEFVDTEINRLELNTDLAFQVNRGRFLIWDVARAAMLARWGHIVGWLTAEECWSRLLPAARRIQARYVSWQDMAACHLQGRLLWSGGTPPDQGRFEEKVRELATDPGSPWNTVPWNLDLDRDW
ncbi:DUF1266 domain-containing protein [Actinomadura flavalba]|uniref:DUF1266 domain-containing protein n=1 Tax=Actinomadura flavalba TaxID=1120938 RepID=UPI0003797A5A|nr:DUF1266 domain-containing protein [Actinomadura flavalba]